MLTATAAESTDPVEDRRRWFPVLWWVGAFLVLLALQHLSGTVLRQEGYEWRWDRPLWQYLGTWSQFDGPEYLKIARDGYWYVPGVKSPVVWFPLYPLLVRLVDGFVNETVVAGVLVSAAAGLASAVLYWRWLAGRAVDGTPRTVGFLVLFLYPYGWFLYGVVHSDSLFLALVLGAFLLVEADRPVLAGLVGALATAARPTGLALVAALVVLALERGGTLRVPRASPAWTRGWVQRFALPVRVHRPSFRWRQLGTVFAVLGVGAYMVFLWRAFGEPLAFQVNQRTYHTGDLPWLKRAFFARWRDFGDDPTYALTIAGQALVAVVVAVASPLVGRRFGWGYAVFTLSLVAIPTLSTENFMGTGRYMIAAFPVAALLGERLARTRWAWAFLAASAALMVGLSMGFARSWYLT